MAAKNTKKGGDSANKPHVTRYAFVDVGYSSGEDFAHNLIASGEFHFCDLKGLHPDAKRSSDKRAAAYEIANAILQSRVKPDDVFRAFCQRSRHMISLRIGARPQMFPAASSTYDFFTRFGSPSWYGPVIDGDRISYVHATEVKHFESAQGSDEPKAYRVRWHVVAEVREHYITFLWNGFTHLDNPEVASAKKQPYQFAYWKYIPKLMQEFEAMLGVSLAEPDLHSAVLGAIWDEFIADPKHVWRHLRIRAEKEGVALNARSSGIKELNIKGIEALTNALARSACTSLLGARPEAKKVREVEIALLRTFIHEWGTKSYEFSLDRDKDKLFKGHCYFGNKQGFDGPDQFAHVRCYDNYGGVLSTLAFLMPYLLGR